MNEQTQLELGRIRHDLSNLRFVVDDYHFPRSVREAVKRRIAELEARRNAIYEREFHIPMTNGD